MKNLRIIAWNVNGIRALIKKIDLNNFLDKHKPHIFCMGETKLSCPDLIIKEKLKKIIKGYKYRYFSTCIAKKGYSGTAIWSKKKPINVSYGINIEEYDQEGRVITLEFANFFLVHVYTPNSGQVLQRLKYRVKEWDPKFWNYISKLESSKKVIVCGDVNCARYEIDIHSPKTNLKSAGFTIQERNSLNSIIKNLNFIDVYRHLYPNKVEYSYWSYMRKSRENNKGWRIDLFLISKKFLKQIKNSKIITDQIGSDHAPIILELKFDKKN